jgi:hypothetical protein
MTANGVAGLNLSAPAALGDAVDRGQLHPQCALEQGLNLLIALAAGVASQQLANDPGGSFAQGRCTPLIGQALAMYQAYLVGPEAMGRRHA